jgi:uncharacterized peroxidase-related enzyme
MTWIATVSLAAAQGRLKTLYERIKSPDGQIDNIMAAHSLRPHSMEGHMALYKQVLHHTSNTLPKWFLEALGVYVSLLNRCAYCVEHHFAGMKRLIEDDARAAVIRTTLDADRPDDAFEGAELAAMRYARMLTRDPGAISEVQIDAMRGAGLDDGQILEVNQVCAYFSYANRTVLGLGVNAEGEVLGLSPNNSDDPDSWGHT